MKIPRIASDKIIRLLKKKGFVPVRQSGSHILFKNEEGTRINVPHHSGKILHPKLVKSIMEDAEIAPDEP